MVLQDLFVPTPIVPVFSLYLLPPFMAPNNGKAFFFCSSDVLVNGKWIAFYYCALQHCLTFTHSYTHSYTDGGVNHARQQPAGREQFGVLLRDSP